MPKSAPLADAGRPADDRAMAGAGSRIRRTTSTLLTCVVLTACQSAPSAEPPSAAGRNGAVAVAPRPPHFAGHLTLAVQPALVSVGETACEAARNRVCSSDGTQGWVPITDPGEATLVEVVARLADEHTSWTAVLRFDRASRPALARAAADAAAAGGVVLLVRDGRARAAVPPPALEGVRATLTGLTKPEAWDLVAAFGPGQVP
jgi:hypothetical protein